MTFLPHPSGPTENTGPTKPFPKGNWGTLLLPINTDDSINWTNLEREIDSLIEAGVSGIYSNGTAGEFYTQSREEFLAISRLLARKCHAASMAFQIGASHPCAQESLERVKATLDLLPMAFQIVLPDWFPVTNSEAIDFLKRIAEAAGSVGLVLYNPPHAKRRLALSEIAALADEIPTLVGIKVAGGDADWYTSMRRELGDTLSVFIPGHHLATGLKAGAHGSYSNIACLDPARAQRWYELAVRDPKAALQVESEILDFMNTHILQQIADGYPNAAVDKLLAGIGGWAEIGTRLRWPYRWLPVSLVSELRSEAQRMLPAFYSL